MENLDCTKLFDVGEKITLSSDFLSQIYDSNSWQQDCIDAQRKNGPLKITKVKSTGIYVEGTRDNWFLTIDRINLYHLEPYRKNPKILYAFADNQVQQGNKRNISCPLYNAFMLKKSLEGYDFWKNILTGKYLKSEESIKNSYKNQQTTQNNNNHEIRLQKQKATIIRGTRPEGSRICSSKHKASIRSGQISYTACHC